LVEESLPLPRAKKDLRRMAVVMAVAAIDSYMHAIVLRRVSTVRKEELPKILRRVAIPFEELASLADTSLEARRAKRRARPWVQVKNTLQRCLLQETFQSFDQVGDALAMAGVEKGWSKVAAQLGEPADSIKATLNALVHRRNQIVHEGDVMRASRPRRLRLNQIYHQTTKEEIDWVESLLDAVEAVVQNEG
jgi:hypothetical protein